MTLDNVINRGNDNLPLNASNECKYLYHGQFEAETKTGKSTDQNAPCKSSQIEKPQATIGYVQFFSDKTQTIFSVGAAPFNLHPATFLNTAVQAR